MVRNSFKLDYLGSEQLRQCISGQDMSLRQKTLYTSAPDRSDVYLHEPTMKNKCLPLVWRHWYLVDICTSMDLATLSSEAVFAVSFGISYCNMYYFYDPHVISFCLTFVPTIAYLPFPVKCHILLFYPNWSTVQSQ